MCGFVYYTYSTVVEKQFTTQFSQPSISENMIDMLTTCNFCYGQKKTNSIWSYINYMPEPFKKYFYLIVTTNHV